MKLPPFSISLSLLFWGWFTGLLPVAICLVPVIECERFVNTKWEFSEKDFNRIADLCTLILTGIVIYILVTNPTKIIYFTVKWLPLIVFPIITVQLYSTAGKINISSLIIIARHNKIRRMGNTNDIDVSYCYIITCVISAGIGNVRNDTFYISIILLSLWILYPLRSKRYHSFLWVSMLVFSSILGYYGHINLYRLQGIITEFTISYFIKKNPDPFKQVTAIGDIGTLKLSNRIVLRVDNKNKKTLLLRQASYTAYTKSKWFATLSGFSAVQPESDKTTWVFKKNINTQFDRITLFTNIGRGIKILALPGGVLNLKNINIEQLENNSLGVVKAYDGSGFTACEISFNSDKMYDRLPEGLDTEIPERLRTTIDNFVKTLNNYYNFDLNTKTPAEKLKYIEHYFTNNYSYSLTQKKESNDVNPIENFLFYTKKGHCEFFATTTVMLLRALNIPARYATGYLVHEYSDFEKMFIVRQRDAHAWTLVYINGKWQNFDTTPSTWVDYENEKNEKTPIVDFLSACKFTIEKWRSELTKDEIARLTGWVLIPLGLFLIFRLRSRDKIRRVKTETKKSKKNNLPVNQGLYLIEEKLGKHGYTRYQWETFAMWFERIKKSEIVSPDSTDINAIITLHYNQRYGNVKITEADKDIIESKTKKVVANL